MRDAEGESENKGKSVEPLPPDVMALMVPVATLLS